MENIIENFTKVNNQTVFWGGNDNIKNVPDESVDFIMTSPPYWDLKKYGQIKGQIGNEEYDVYIERLVSLFSECYRVAKDGSIFVLNINSRRSKGVFYPIA